MEMGLGRHDNCGRHSVRCYVLLFGSLTSWFDEVVGNIIVDTLPPPFS